jgi:hypothetical protein
MNQPLTDQRLRQLQALGGPQAASDEAVAVLLLNVVESYPRAKIHWLTDTAEAIRNDWYAARLAGGRLAGMIDKAGSAKKLRSLAAEDLYQYAVEKLRPTLRYRLFERLDKLLHEQDRFSIFIKGTDPGATSWTLTARPATAAFSERDRELKSLVFAVDLKTLEEKPDARKQTQFVIADELARYAYQMLERSGRALTLEQLVHGLVITYGLDPSVEGLPDESSLADRHYAAEDAGVPMTDGPALPTSEFNGLARQLLNELTARQVEILKRLHEGYQEREIAELIGCSASTVLDERRKIQAVISGLAPPEDLHELLSATLTLLYGDDHEL